MSAPHAPSTTQSPLAWQLIGLSPALGDLTLNVDRDLTVGRNAQNDIVLASGQVSRQHARLSIQAKRLQLQDLGSANGTFVNGKRLSGEPVTLQLGDEVAFADLAFVVASEDLADGMDALAAVLTTPNTATTEVYTISHEPPTAKAIATDNAIQHTATADIDTPPVRPATATQLPNATSTPQPTTTTNTDNTASPFTPDTPTPELLPTSTANSQELAKQGSKHSTVAIAIVVIVALIIIVALFFR